MKIDSLQVPKMFLSLIQTPQKSPEDRTVLPKSKLIVVFICGFQKDLSMAPTTKIAPKVINVIKTPNVAE